MRGDYIFCAKRNAIGANLRDNGSVSIGANIRRFRKAKKLTLDQVAVPAGMDSGNLSRVERDLQSVNHPKLRAIASILGVKMADLLSDELHEKGALSDQATGHVTARDALPGRVPCLPWRYAGDWEYLRSGTPDNWEWMPISKHMPFGRGMAVVLEGESMLSEQPPTFPPGTILVLEDKAPKPGDFVIALPGPKFKRLVEDGGVFFLQPLNPRFPMTPLGDAKVAGVVVEAVTRTVF